MKRIENKKHKGICKIQKNKLQNHSRFLKNYNKKKRGRDKFQRRIKVNKRNRMNQNS